MKKTENPKERRRNAFPNFDYKMKFSFLFLMITFFQLQAETGYAQKISLNMQKASVKEVMAKIETISDYKFFYSASDVDLERKVDITLKEEKIERVLSELFTETKVDYNVVDEQIILKPKKIRSVRRSIKRVSQQQFQVGGTVVDDDGLPLPGASVVEKGTNNGTQTDFDGNFTLTITDENATLVFSYIRLLDLRK